MTAAARRNLLIGGAIVLAVPFFAGILRKNYVQLPRIAWIALVMLAMAGAAIGLFVMNRAQREDR